MALLEIFHAVRHRFLETPLRTISTESHAQVVQGTFTFNYYGSNFLYDQYNWPRKGVLTGLDLYDSAKGGLQVRVSGLNAPFEGGIYDPWQFIDSYFGAYLFGDDTLLGSADADTLNGSFGTDYVEGRGGHDRLLGGMDNFVDTLKGGAGDDTYEVGNQYYGPGEQLYFPNDLIVEARDEGRDRVISWGSFVLPDNVEDLWVRGFGDIIGIGNELDNVIEGGNFQFGRGGNDTLIGSGWLRGGEGDDKYIVRAGWPSIVDESAHGGIDTVEADQSYLLGAHVENLVLDAYGSLVGRGNSEDNLIIGHDAGDTLEGGRGNDTLKGGVGNDWFGVDSWGDVVEDAGGLDTIATTLDSYVLAAGIENLQLRRLAIVGTGNELDNLITGAWANNRLLGLGGNDTLDGGQGADTLVGGDGDDTYIVDSAADVIVEFAGGGNDTVVAAYSYALSGVLENLKLSAPLQTGYGNAQSNGLAGSSGSDTLDGGEGADTLAGGAGVDVYFVDDVADVVLEIASDDADIVYASVDFDLRTSPYVHNLTLTGHARIATGNGEVNVINGNALANVLVAQAGRWAWQGDRLWGGAGDDSLLGSSAWDVLDGGKGADTMVGGGGNDTFVIDNPGDVILEDSADNGSEDTVEAWISHVLADGFEVLRLMGSDDLDGSGSTAGSETIVGNSGANRLSAGSGEGDLVLGMEGDDTLLDAGGTAQLRGGAGNDLYIVTGSRTTVLEHWTQGRDTVRAAVDFILPEEVEDLVLLDGARSGTGNFGNNVILGNRADNVLAGGWGNDTLDGDAGRDRATYLGYLGLRSDFVISRHEGTVIVEGPLGKDTLIGIDEIEFADDFILLNPHVAQGHVVVEGLADSGKVLSASVGYLEDADGVGVVGYQWFRDGVAITGATSVSYQLGQADAGSAVSARARFVDGLGNTESIWSIPMTIAGAPIATPHPSDPPLRATAVWARPVSEVDAEFWVSFDDVPHRGTGNVILRTAAGAIVESFDVATSERISLDGAVVIDPSAPLQFGTSYVLEIPAGAFKDAAGRATTAATRLSHTTGVQHTTDFHDPGQVSLSGKRDADSGLWFRPIGAGVDYVGGDMGIDVAVYDGARADYTITHFADHMNVASNLDAADVDWVARVERLQFDDESLAFDIDGNAGQAYRLYQAAFDRKPDLEGLGYQLNELDKGWQLTWVASNFIASPEFSATYGALSNAQFVTQLYRNVLDREPEAEGLAYHLSRMAGGVGRDYILAGFSESPENKANVIGAIEDGIVYIL